MLIIIGNSGFMTYLIHVFEKCYREKFFENIENRYGSLNLVFFIFFQKNKKKGIKHILHVFHALYVFHND